MMQIDNKFVSTNPANHMIGDAFGKQVCHMYPQSSNQIGQYVIVMPPVGIYFLIIPPANFVCGGVYCFHVVRASVRNVLFF